MENINFGIDLGTTNSGIGKFQSGKVNIYKNPVGFRDVLPSVVAYRNGRILVGDKARELTTAQPENVFSSFKRKMGSEHSYPIPSLQTEQSAIDFSALVLKELLSFVGDEKPNAAVITIPASFDTVQSNATKTAGHQAGLNEVLLLQEPIAACLAYANTQNISIAQPKTWLVYDFGGGTFDVALVKIDERELKVIDHEGNNFLGGLDIDNLMVEHLFCPVLEKELGIEKLWKQMVSAENAYYKLFVELLYKAEEAKKELSLKEEVYIELEVDSKFIEFPVTRSRFNELIYPKVAETIKLTKRLLEKNHIGPNEIERIVLVGGTTYIPYVKTSLQENFETMVDSSIDPTTAIIVGASYYAGTKSKQEKALPQLQEEEKAPQLQDVKLVYEVNSQDGEELITGLVPNEFSGYYRIIRTDGGFDTGLIAFHSKFNEFVKLVPKTINFFQVKIFDKYQKQVFEQNNLGINHGVYNISGQPLPNDICLEIDDTIGTTYLERIFKKNDILPLSKKIYKTISKTILKDSDEKLIINIVEGKAETSPASNLCVGYIEIAASDLSSNLLKGTDIEIDFEISESRDLKVDVYIGAINLEINQVFNASARQVSLLKLTSELEKALNNVDYEIEVLEQYETLMQLEELRIELIELLKDLIDLEEDVVTDKIYNVDERKRKALQHFDGLVRSKNVIAEISDYQAIKQEIKEDLLLHPSIKHEQVLNSIIKNEQQFLSSNQSAIIKSKIRDLNRLARELHYQKDESYIDLFYYSYAYRNSSDYVNEKEAGKYIERGEKAIQAGNYAELKAMVSALYNLLKVKPKDYLEDQNGTLGLK